MTHTESNSSESSSFHNLASATDSIRAVFLDIDGTLVGPTETVSPAVRRAIDRVRARGVEVVLCTGRARHTAEPIAHQIGPPLGYVVTSNGGVTMHLGRNEVLHARLLPIPVALQVVRAILAVGVEPYIYESAISGDMEGARVLHHPDLPVGPFATRPRYRPHATLTEDLPFEPVSINAFGPIEKMRSLVDRLTRQLPEGVTLIQTGSSDHWGIEIFSGGVSKRLGLETLAAHLHLKQSQIMAVGDHMNDLEMIAWAGVGVAMGNALPEVKAVADWITTSVEEDGVAHALAHFLPEIVSK